VVEAVFAVVVVAGCIGVGFEVGIVVAIGDLGVGFGRVVEVCRRVAWVVDSGMY
jgi:hypothetical protein